MEYIEYFKKQSKKLLKDYQNSTRKCFDIDYQDVLLDHKTTKYTLMKVQHKIANLAGFRKWQDLIKASEKEIQEGICCFETYIEGWISTQEEEDNECPRCWTYVEEGVYCEDCKSYIDNQ